ncbi:MAG: ribonuclease Z [Bacteroidales bacterium]|nr:ribonuclease Z [Bacteroidales bacterium]
MIPFKLKILGAGSAIPSLHRAASAQLLQYNGSNVLIDCAEGTQMQLKKNKISAMRIDHILISHLHGDHYFGLIGLLSSLHLIGRTQPIHVYGPPALIDILHIQLKAADTKLRFPLIFQPLDSDGFKCVYSGKYLDFFSFPVLHRIPTWGFLIREKSGEPNIKSEFVAKYQPNPETIRAIKSGENFTADDGEIIHNNQITHTLSPPRSYAYCTDTAYFEPLIEYIKGVNLLYHEATFMSKFTEEAKNTFHSTSVQAAEIAKKANVGKLLLGHFSSRYNDLNPLLAEAQEVFPNTDLALDGSAFEIE